MVAPSSILPDWSLATPEDEESSSFTLVPVSSCSRTASNCGTVARVVDADGGRGSRVSAAAGGGISIGGGSLASDAVFTDDDDDAVDESSGVRAAALGPPGSAAAAIAALCASISLRFSAISASSRGSGASRIATENSSVPRTCASSASLCARGL